MTQVNLDYLFMPRSIAVVGASADPTRIGGRPIRSSLDAGFTGSIFPINPKYRQVQGLRCYSSLSEVPQAVDLVVVALPARYVPEVVEEASQVAARSMVIFSSGYAETGELGRIAQAQLVAQVAATEMVMLGPNCLGVINASLGAVASFSSAFESGPIRDGNVGFLCQSGAFGSYFLTLARSRALGVGLWAATGNEASLSSADCIEYLVGVDEIKVIAGYLEGVQDLAQITRALQMAHEAKKPVILLKAGRSAVGSQAALSHTGAVVGDDGVFAALLERYGAYRARDLEDLLDLVEACSLGSYPRGPRTCLMSVSGGAGIIMADAAVAAKLDLSEPEASVQRELKEIVPYASVSNPVDFTGQFLNDPSIAGRFLERLASSEQFDAFVIFLGHTAALNPRAQEALETIARLARRDQAKFYLVATISQEMQDVLREAGVVISTSPTAVVALIAEMIEIRRSLESPLQGAPKHLSAATRLEIAATLARYIPSELLEDADARKVLGSIGIGVVISIPAQTPEDAGRIAHALGFPVAIKITSPQVSHRSRAGGVRVGLMSASEVQIAAYEMIGKVAARVPGSHIEGFVVEPMVGGGPEMILEARRDSSYGPVIVARSGGVLSEELNDAAMAMAPASKVHARRLLGNTVVAQSVRASRFEQDYSIEPLVEVVVNLSRLLASVPSICQVKLNVILQPRDEAPVVADAQVRLCADGALGENSFSPTHEGS